jgi:hypothetical protein
MDKVCPFCGSDIVATVEVVYIRKIDRVTGEMQPRGKKMAEEIVNVKCSKCNGVYDALNGGWLKYKGMGKWE